MAQEMSQEDISCNRPDFDRTTDTGIYIWQICSTNEWFFRVSAGGLPAGPNGVEFRVIGSLELSQPIVSIEEFSLAPVNDEGGPQVNDQLDTPTRNAAQMPPIPFDPENITFNLRVFAEAQDGFDFVLEEGTTACLTVSTSIDAPIVIGGDSTVVTSPINIETASKTLCLGGSVVPPTSLLLLDDED